MKFSVRFQRIEKMKIIDWFKRRKSLIKEIDALNKALFICKSNNKRQSSLIKHLITSLNRERHKHKHE